MRSGKFRASASPAEVRKLSHVVLSHMLKLTFLPQIRFGDMTERRSQQGFGNRI